MAADAHMASVADSRTKTGGAKADEEPGLEGGGDQDGTGPGREHRVPTRSRGAGAALGPAPQWVRPP